MKIAGTVRSLPAGAGVAGITVEVRTHQVGNPHVPGSPVVTDTNGRWSLTVNGNPGPYFWRAVDTTPPGAAPDIVRGGSSQSYGSGGAYSLYELPWALRARGHGVVSGLAVGAPTGLSLPVASGAVLANGIPAVWHSGVTYAVDPTLRNATNPRACYLCVAVTGMGQLEEGKAELVTVCGTPAASPVLPGLTQDELLYHVPLASFRLPNTGSTTLTLLDNTVKPVPGQRNPTLTSIVRRTNPAAPNTYNGTTDTDAVGLTTSLTLLAGVAYDLTGRVWLASNIDTLGQSGMVAIYLNTTANLSEFVANASQAVVGVSNVHTVENVLGTGAPVSCGVRIKVSNAPAVMGYGVGYFQAIARPRW